jgi:hypothetical protein
MHEQVNGKIISVPTPQRPGTNDPKAWRAYWEAQGQLWRTEPEIDIERQRYLAERRAITPDIEQSIYPFKGIKLSRGDVEWLLATHENGRGPVSWRLAAFEAVIGLLIEISFIATFTQRFFGK